MRRTLPRWQFALVLCVASAGVALAQPGARPVPADPAAATAPRGAKVLGLADVGEWKRITGAAISPDGKWMTYTYQPNDGDATLFVKQLDGAKVYETSTGAAGGGGRGGFGGGGGGAQFSDDSRWVVYTVNPPTPPAGRGGRNGGGARGGGGAPAGGRGAAQGAGGRGNAPQRHLELLDLASGAKFEAPNAASFRFAKGAKWLAIKLNKPVPDTSYRGSDLLLRDLATGSTRNIGNVDEFDFDDAGRLLAYTVDATDRLGNGIYVLDMASGTTRALSSDTAHYAQLSWSDSSTNLAVLRGLKPRDSRERVNAVLAWRNVDATTPAAVSYDPAQDPAFPPGMVVSEYAAPRWSADGAHLYLGIREQEAEPPRSTEPEANVDVWHWKDPEPQSVQMLRVNQDRRATFLSVLDLNSRKFTQLADSAMRTVSYTPEGSWGVGRLDEPYRIENSWGWSNADYYRVNLATGARTLIEKNLMRAMGTSPDSKWFLYLRDKHVHAFNLETAQNLVIDATAGRSFVDEDDDHAAEKPVYGVAGWAKDGQSVLLYHKYDVWQLPLTANGKAVNLTRGVGDAQQIQFRVVHLEGGGGRGGRGGGFGGGGGGAGASIDLTQPQLLSAYGEWTKKSGYYTLPPGQAPTPLLYADKQIGGVTKADSADRVIFTEQTFQEFPDYWVSDTRFSAPKKVTDANPQLAEYAWGSKVLIDYTNSKGKRLQATLTLPAGYEPGKKYPMLVYFYEIMSNTHHTFSMPVYDDRPHMSEYASDGYLVLQPDVVYEIGKPGTSAVDCVTSAVKKVIALGYADPKHIGLQGHSWGGYESSFIVTQTDMFAAVVTGAPLTDLVSMYNILYKQSGTVNGGILEMSQGRMGVNVTPTTNPRLYEDQSPIYHVQNIRTPFMILQGTADGAVDWNQGLEFYNAARRAGKQVILLSYPGEPHHLAKKENQKDFQIRMKEFFDHYLKGTPAPPWMTDGVPQVHKGEQVP